MMVEQHLRHVEQREAMTARTQQPEPISDDDVMRLVVVGIDGSEESQRGLRFAAQFARRLDVELLVVHVLGLTTHLGGHIEPAHGHESDVADVMEREWCAPLDDVVGLRWRSEVVQGQPAAGLIEAAEAADAGFIVVGSHGAGNSSVPLMGSTSHYVVSTSRRPVVVVPPQDNHPARRPIGAGAMNPAVADS